MAMTPEQRAEAKKAAQRRWREKNPGRQAQLSKAWREKNPDRVRENERRWRAANLERRQELTNAGVRRWEERNPEKKKARLAAWQKSNPQACIEASQRRRARVRGTEPDFTPKQWNELLDEFDYACAYCQARGVPLEREHLTPLARGGRHTKLNIVPACRSCNAKKGKKTMLEFLTVAA